jgi:hypothetical protein
MTMQIVQSDADRKECESYIERFGRLAEERTNWENHWQDCMDYIVPRKNDVISSRPAGDKRGAELFDTTAIMSNQLLSSALHSMLTNPATRFFDLLLAAVDEEIDDDAKKWLQDVSDRMFQILNNSNFQTEVHEIYIDLGSIGTACLWMGDDEDKVVHFAARPMKEIYVDENNLGLIDTVYRKFSWKPRQMVQEFGEDKLPPELLKCYREGSDKPWEILHCVHPMSDAEYEARGKIHKYKSVYLLKECSAFLSKDKAFHEFPYAVPRWTKTSGEKYGRGPGMDMLPDIRMVNKMMETTLKGAQKTVDPPMMVADDGVIGKVRLTPGGLTVVRPMSDVPIRPLIVDARIDFGFQAIERIRSAIRAGFFVDQLQLNEGPQMTATEVNQRTEEKLRLMGPVLGRQHFEFLRVVIDRLFGIMKRKGLLPEAPRSIQGKALDVRYSSLVARAQRMSEGQNLTRAITVAAPIINADPKALDNLDSDQAFQYVMDIYGIPRKIIRGSRQVKEIRDARAQAEQQMVQQQQQQAEAEMVSKVAPGVAQLQQAAQKK